MRLDVLLRLKQASFVCFISRGEASNKPDNMWIESDIYAQSPHSRVVSLPISGIVDDKLVFDVFLSVDYEIRLFGDPRFTEAEETPVSRVYLSIDIYNSSVVHIEGPSIVPDFVEGWALGDALGIYIQNNREWNSLASVTCDSTVRMCVLCFRPEVHGVLRSWSSSSSRRLPVWHRSRDVSSLSGLCNVRSFSPTLTRCF
jgi:hypothetical protein